MRPLGHTETRQEREAVVIELDHRIVAAWNEYVSKDFSYYNDIHPFPVPDYISYLKYAIELLGRFQPSCDDLQRFTMQQCAIVRDWDGGGELLGQFLTAGYHVASESTIVHYAVTPDVHGIGAHLEKDLIITGAVGDRAGECMTGTLTNRGCIGDNAGYAMVGTFVNHGATGHFAASGMVGYAENYGTMGARAAHWMRGVFTNAGSIEPYVCYGKTHPLFHEFDVGLSDDHGLRVWHSCDDHEGFLRALENPDHLDGRTLSLRLGRYRWKLRRWL